MGKNEELSRDTDGRYNCWKGEIRKGNGGDVVRSKKGN